MNLLQNKKQAKNFAFAVGLLSILGIGGFVASSATSQGATLSKFNQTAQVTTQTVSTLWTPSTDNPHRAKLINYGHAARTDAIIVLMLKKGLTLDKATFTTYLRNLQAGITSMANESTFKNDQEIQEIANYIAYEITDTTNVLNGRDIFFQRLNDLINQVQVNGTGSTSTGTGSTGTGSTGAANGSTEQLLSDLAALIQGTSPTIVTTTTTSTGTTTTTSGSGTGNVTEQLLGDLAALINGSTSTTATTGTTTTSTGSNDSTGSTSTGTTTASSGTTADLMNDLGALINNTGTEAANTNTQGTTASTSSSNGTTATVTTSADTTTTTSTVTTGSTSTTATTGTSGSTTSTTTTNGTTTTGTTTGTTTSGTTGATTNNDQAGQLIDDLLRLIG